VRFLLGEFTDLLIGAGTDQQISKLAQEKAHESTARLPPALPNRLLEGS
jgi:hypothetical protein